LTLERSIEEHRSLMARLPIGRRPPVATTPRPGGLADAGRRVDEQTGAVEETGFHGPDGRRIFTATHLPAGDAIGGVVICSPLYAEFLHNYRKEVILGRSLAARGVAVQRFHYRGTGNSDGDGSELRFAPMLEDALAAVELLRSRSSVDRVAFLGTRLGALIAASAASGSEAPVALWEPVLDPVHHFREILRAARIRDLKDGVASDGSPMERLARDGVADVLGYSVHGDLLESLRDRRLPDDLGDRPRRVLLLQLARGGDLRGPYARMLSTLEDEGWPVEARPIRATDSWWFSGNPDDAARTLEAVVAATVDWLEAAFGGR
jgi:hypothetical protein